MSNSIWKKPEENPDANKGFACYKSNLSLVENNRYLQNGAVKPDREWGYVKEIIDQADKAERLQKAVDNSREKLAAFMHDIWSNWFAYQLNNSTIENLQRWGIQSNTPYSSLTETDKDKDRKFADKIIEIIKDKIKQLIKENQ